MARLIHLMLLLVSRDIVINGFAVSVLPGRANQLYSSTRPTYEATELAGEPRRIAFVSSLATVVDNGDDPGDDDDDGDVNADIGGGNDASPELRALLLARNAQFLTGLRLRKEAIDTVLRYGRGGCR